MSKYRILIVDDDNDARRLLSIALGARYEVVEACDGLDALSKLELYEPDMAIIDIMMPMMDGYQLCEAIRKNPVYKSMQVIFLSAFGSTENVKKSYAVGANLFLTKPVDPDRVLKNIDFTMQREPPPLRVKKYSIAQIKQFATQGPMPPKPQQPEPALQSQAQPAHPTPPPQSKPATQPPAAHQAQPTPTPTPPSGSRTGKAAASSRPAAPGALPRVLAVDDDPELLEMVEIALRDQFEVTMADNGLAAIERLVDYEPDLMILDIMMPKMNGYQLLQSVRRNQFFKSMPVVVLSAKSSPKDREYAQRLGANDFIAKPYSVDNLLESLDKIVADPNFKVRHKKMTMAEIHERAFKSSEEMARRKNQESFKQDRERDTERNINRQS